jgi:thymidylate synthase
MKQYHQALSHVLSQGVNKVDRTGVGTRSVFGYQMRFNLQEGFPAVTTKKLAWRAVVSELLWFLEGSGDERRLAEILHGTRDLEKKTIWTANAKADYWLPKAQYEGDLGRVYGVQWRDFNGVDQISNLIEGIKRDPSGRRHLLTAWNPAELTDMALPPCHVLSQFDVTNGRLSCQLYQRSCDMFLGVPFNIASYSLLTYIIAEECGLEVGDFVWTGGDCHIYNNHVNAVNEQLARTPKQLPTLEFPKGKKIANYIVNDFQLLNYNPDPAIKADMAV